MKIFLAGMNTAPDVVYKKAAEHHANILMSYYYFRKTMPAVLKVFWRSFGVFVDSGGYSARVQGVPISVEKYRDMLLALQGHYQLCANLDTSSVEESLHNQRVLERAGLEPMPVYHYTEFVDPRYRTLIRDWAREYPMIAVAVESSVKSGSESGREYLDYVFEATGTSVKVHGFSATRQELLERYPFYSVDSTTWLASGKYGAHFSFSKGKIIRKDKPGSGGTRDRWSRGVLLNKPARMTDSVLAFLQLEKYLTDLWVRRGVTWI